MSGWQISGIIVASALAALLLSMAFLLAVRLGAVIIEAQTSLRRVTDEVIPTLQGVTVTVDHVNDELVRVDTIAANVEQLSANVSGLSSVIAATLGGPLIRVSSFSYGVRQALAGKRADWDAKRATVARKNEKKAARSAKKKG